MKTSYSAWDLGRFFEEAEILERAFKAEGDGRRKCLEAETAHARCVCRREEGSCWQRQGQARKAETSSSRLLGASEGCNGPGQLCL